MRTIRGGRTDAAILALLAAMTLAFFWKIALTNRILAGLDVFSYFYPYRDYVSESLRAGRLPLWNPYLFMGAPLLANSQAAVLYPLHWPLIWLSAPKQVAWSVVIHIWLAAAGTYLFARKAWHSPALPALVSAVVFAFGGFLGAQVEHLNQLNASAWLPWLLLCLDGMFRAGRRRWLALAGGAAVVAMALLAGHTQATYIVLAGATAYALLRGWRELMGRRGPRRLKGLAGVGMLGLMTGLGALLAAAQLLPTWELSRLSVRSGGLPYEEAASFSLKPSLILKAFLPPLVWAPPFSEFTAYVGLLGLALAALGGWALVRRRLPEESRAAGVAALVLTALGVFLAFGAYNPAYFLLYKLVPGFDLFRAPARWLLLYSFGAALMAGIGTTLLPTRRRSALILALLLTIELFVAGRRLAYNHPTAPAAFDSMRTAPSHLLANASPEPWRFLSLSDIAYDPGDLADLQAMYDAYLPDRAIYDLVVATKMKEVLAFDLPLRYRLSGVDGYDGGLLPTAEYMALERLFLPDQPIWSDGRLRQQLHELPPARLLSLLNVRYAITDKSQDAWIDDVYYDLEHSVPLGQVSLTDLPGLDTTRIGLISYLSGGETLMNGTPVADLVITSSAGTILTRTLLAGQDTAEGLYSPQLTTHRQARVAHHWRDNVQGNDYLALFDLDRVVRPQVIAIRSLLPQDSGVQVVLRGLTLIDGRSGASRSVSVDPAYRLVHSGDVKIYENRSAQLRAFVVYSTRVIEDEEEALALLRHPDFDPAREAVLTSGRELVGQPEPTAVRLVEYKPERISLDVSLASRGYVILSDAYYPGWTASVDGQRVAIQRADLYFRAVEVEEGHHRVSFEYRPANLRLGLWLSGGTWAVWGLLVTVGLVLAGRNRPDHV